MEHYERERRRGDEERYGREGGYEERRRGQEHGRRREERGFTERAGDEVRSWFGDEEARRRRMEDERRGGEGWRGEGWQGWREGERAESRWAPGEPWGGGQGRYYGQGQSYYGAEGQGHESYGQWGPGYGQQGHGQWGPGPAGQRSYRGPGERPSGQSGQGGWYGGGAQDWMGQGSRWAGSQGAGSEGSWSGPHAGKGPKGYQRADERIREEVCERLARHGEIDASEIEVQVREGEVVLQGQVDSRWTKRMAEDVIESVFGVREVNNQLRVAAGGGAAGQESALGSQPGQAGRGGHRAA